MHIERIGDGRRRFLGVHGWAGSHRTFLPLTAKMPADCVFHAVDLPGYGASPAPAPLTAEKVVAAVADVIADLADPDLVVTANCGGAWLALTAIETRRIPVGRVVLVDPFAFMPLYFAFFTWPLIGSMGYHLTFASGLGRALTNRALAKKRTGDTNLTKGFAQINHKTTLRYLHIMKHLARRRAFRNVACPVDLAYGEKTFEAVRASLPFWRGQFAAGATVELAGAGHEPIREATRQLAALVFGVEEEAA